MREFFDHLWDAWNFDDGWQLVAVWGLALASTLILAYVLGWLIKGVLGGAIRRVAAHTQNRWDDYLLDKRFFTWLGRLVPSVVGYFLLISLVTPDTVVVPLTRRLFQLWICVTATGFANQVIGNFERGFLAIQGDRRVPIRSYVQVVKILLFLVSGILIVAIVLDQNPIGILTGLGALTAVLLLVFRDSLLGLVASWQLNSNDLVQIGDWIEIPGQNIDGEIIDIALSVVRIRAGDNTIYSLPTYSLVSSTFKNWRNVAQVGARRLKLVLSLDAHTVGALDPERRQSLDEAGLWKAPPGRTELTNLEAFRDWAQAYLDSHGDVHPDLVRLVKFGDLTGRGVPVEAVFYTRLTGYPDFEHLRSRLLCALLAALPAFGLRVFQG